MCVYYFCLDLAVANAFALFRLATPRPSRKRGFTQLDFRVQLVEQLLSLASRLRGEAATPGDVYITPGVAAYSPRVGNLRGAYRQFGDPFPPERFVGLHLPTRLPPSSRRFCDVCHATRATVVCSCGFFLCLTVERPCFARFHDPAEDPGAGVPHPTASI